MNNRLQSKFSLKSKNALITGGAGLLGIQHAIALLDLGAKVILTDINQEMLERAKKKLVETFEEDKIIIELMDVTSKESVLSAKNKLITKGLKIDILINNAAIDPKVKGENVNIESSRLEHYSLDQWNLEMSVGLTGSFLCSQIFGSEMAKNTSGGVILNISSDLSVISPNQNLYRKHGLPDELQPVKPVTYSVIKTGLIGLTRYLATYWAKNNVRCNALSPGGVYNEQGENFVLNLTSLIPMNRMAYPDEYIGAVQFLCSDASAYLNGQNIVMDGGRSVW
jgi:NAD(P)-dependent dehydrogenase (short-subunit alcohol dehydrogenase family)